MIYLGWFEFDVPERKESGRFNLIVEADGFDTSLDKFKKLLRGELDALKDVKEIFITSLTEINKAPETALMINFEQGTSESSLFCCCPGSYAKEGEITVFSSGEFGEFPGDTYENTPFVVRD